MKAANKKTEKRSAKVKKNVAKKGKPLFDRNESFKFLIEEYRFASRDTEHHNNFQMSITKFIFSFFTAFSLVAITLYDKFSSNIGMQLSIFLLIGFVIGFVMFLLMLRNRVNYVRALKQTVSLRKFFMENMEIDFRPHNSLYIDPSKVKVFKRTGIYAYSILTVMIFNSVLASMSFISFCYSNFGGFSFKLVVFFAVIVLAVQLNIAKFYLRTKEGI
jgi:hypothetical protein